MHPDHPEPPADELEETLLESITSTTYPALNVHVDFIDLFDKMDGDLERVYTVLGDLKDLLS